MIDHTLRRIHIHIPKTAGTSLRSVLLPNADRTVHKTASHFPADVWEEYFSFAFVRNPFERIVSAYSYHVKGRYRGALRKRYPHLSTMAFAQYLRELVVPQTNQLFFPMITYLTHPDSAAPVDFLGRFENLEQDYRRLAARLDVDLPLPHAFASRHEHYSYYYDEETRAVVAKVYSQDLERFGYEFEAPVSSAAAVPHSQDVATTIRKVWEEHPDEDYRRDQSHWRGEGRWSQDKWEAIGKGTLQRLQRMFGKDLLDRWREDPPVVIEWGPGGGTNLYALAPYARHLYGVDISRSNLDETQRVLKERSGAPFTPALLQDRPEEALDHVEHAVDVVVSTATFQHFPSQQYGADVLRILGELCAPGAIGLLQIRFDNGNPRYAPKRVEEYAERHITATSYELSAFWDLCVTGGLRPLSIFGVNTRNNYAYIAFTKA